MNNDGSINTLKSWIKQNEETVSATNVVELDSHIEGIREEIKQAEKDCLAATESRLNQIDILRREIAIIEKPYDEKISNLQATSDNLSKEARKAETAKQMIQYHRKALQVLELQAKGYKILECQASWMVRDLHIVGKVVRGTNFQANKYTLVQELVMTRTGVFLINNVAKTPRKIASLTGEGIERHTYRWIKIVMVPGPLVTKPIVRPSKRTYDEPDGFEVVYKPEEAIVIANE